MSAAATVTVTCSRCARTTTDPARDYWLMRSVPLVVQGITLGVCVACLGGDTPSSDSPDDGKPCGGRCDGAYTGQHYYVAECHECSGDGAAWRCWDKTCVEVWADEHPDDDCDECGRSCSFAPSVYEMRDGKRVSK